MAFTILAFLSFFKSETLDLQDLIDEYTSQEFNAALYEIYRASSISLESRHAAFVGMKSDATLDLEAEISPAFHLINTTVSLKTIVIIPSNSAPFAEVKNDSLLLLEQCTYSTMNLLHPILLGERSKLAVDTLSFVNIAFASPLISGYDNSDNPTLSISLLSCSFENSTVETQTPIVAGDDIERIAISDSTFVNITCTDKSVLPTTPMSGVPSRSIEIVGGIWTSLDGPLSGSVVFGIQAHSLLLKSVEMTYCCNAARFWGNIALLEKTDITVISSKITSARTSPAQPNGSFLFLFHRNIALTLIDTIFYECTASQDGGCLWSCSTLTATICECAVVLCSAEGNGGFMCSSGDHADIVLLNSTFDKCGACGNGGVVFSEGVQSLNESGSVFKTCTAKGSGGVMALVARKTDTQLNTLPPLSRLLLNHSTFSNCSAEQDGGCVWTDSAVLIDLLVCNATNSSAGGSGGFVCSCGTEANVTSTNTTSRLCSAGKQGGSLFVAGMKTFSMSWDNVSNCTAEQSGGGVALIVENDAELTFWKVDFANNSYSSSVGNDVVVLYKASTAAVLTKEDFATCWSTSELNKVSLLPMNTNIDWKNPRRPDAEVGWWMVAALVVGGCFLTIMFIAFSCVFIKRSPACAKSRERLEKRNRVEQTRHTESRSDTTRQDGQERESSTTSTPAQKQSGFQSVPDAYCPPRPVDASSPLVHRDREDQPRTAACAYPEIGEDDVPFSLP
ncbi:hypothetical protein BLNAU_10104 [Blattamonas nauphoetae]|uniref:Transmembrane protein n=1 Tax=Blattamonas nauphoetae TaxID=2049346 RepID=A0ABQ9XU16_9EUKA|nr:hypothetical protein BLNAU_10104 [Blattamonas nauphoetae]